MALRFWPWTVIATVTPLLNRSSNLATVMNYTHYNCATFYIQLSLVVTILLKIR